MLPGFLVRTLPTARTSCNLPRAFSPPSHHCLFLSSSVLGTTVFPTLTPVFSPARATQGGLPCPVPLPSMCLALDTISTWQPLLRSC